MEGKMDLKQYLEKQGLSISKFAKMCDLPEITVTKYKYGDRIPNKLNMKKIYAVTVCLLRTNVFKFYFTI